jgi:hypothetical protein
MMIIDEDKSFGYPVLRPLYSDQSPSELDYVNIPFEPVLGMALDRADTDSVVFTWEYECRVPSITKLLNSGGVKATLNLYNRSAWLNKSIDLSAYGPEGEVSIDRSVASGVIEVMLVLTATKELEIQSDAIHEDYGFKSFTVPKNSIIAYSEAEQYDALTNLLKNVESLFDLSEDSTLDDGEFYYDYTGDRVDIYGNEDLILSLREFEASERLQNFILSAIYAPVITELVKIVFEKQDDDSDSEVVDLLWFRTIREKIQDLPHDKIQKHRPQVTAHYLVNRPLSKISVD